eukprot:CAMPEP_0170604790 /NCGR_PEP_ID=MMETSP0224-20130122/19622_1 /TAXON_ID=285029 /ORGANISM="Togula jolla, Strain CCCM 725" /LENGTH=808 /DNA_ID=CAMNT_0010929739 /DNA_START=40 /DNA_END=2466 /DNA_ORIENTATION=-
MRPLQLLFLGDGLSDCPPGLDRADPALAQVLASVAFHMYEEADQSHFRPQRLEGWQDVQPFLVETESLRACMYRRNLVTIIGIRGTDNPANLLGSTQCRMASLEADFGGGSQSCLVHRGLQVMAQQLVGQFERKGILQQLNNQIAASSGEGIVYCVGHSIGGALALLVALRLAQMQGFHREDSLRVVGFAAPRVGNAEFNELCRRHVHRISWIASAKDLIPRLPVVPGYVHVVRPQVLQGPEDDSSTNLMLGLASLHFLLGALTAMVQFEPDDCTMKQHSCATYWELLFEEAGANSSLTRVLELSSSEEALSPASCQAKSAARACITMMHIVAGSMGSLKTAYGLRWMRTDLETLLLKWEHLTQAVREQMPSASDEEELSGFLHQGVEDTKRLIDLQISDLECRLQYSRNELRQAIEDSATSIRNVDVQRFLDLADAVESLDSWTDAYDFWLQNQLGDLQPKFNACLATLSILRAQTEAAITPATLKLALTPFHAACCCVADAHKEALGKLTVLAMQSAVQEVRKAAQRELRGNPSSQRRVHAALIDHIGCICWFSEAFAPKSGGTHESLAALESIHYCSALLDSEELGSRLLIPVRPFAMYAREPHNASAILVLAESDTYQGHSLASTRACRAALSVLSSEPVGALRVLNDLFITHPVVKATESLWPRLGSLFVENPRLRAAIGRVLAIRYRELRALQSHAARLLLTIPSSDVHYLGGCIAAAQEAPEDSRPPPDLLHAAKVRLLELLAGALRRGVIEDVQTALEGARAADVGGPFVERAACVVENHAKRMATICPFATCMSSPYRI